jgi:hypothetical protein
MIKASRHLYFAFLRVVIPAPTHDAPLPTFYQVRHRGMPGRHLVSVSLRETTYQLNFH